MATRLEMRNKVYAFLDANTDGTDRWSHDDVDAAIDKGEEQFAKDTGILRDEDTSTTLTEGEATAALPSTLLEIIRIERADGEPLVRADAKRMDLFRPGWRSAADGTPVRFFHGDEGRNVLRVWPAPDAAAVAACSPLRAFIIRRPTPMATDNTESELPVEFHDAPMWWAIWELYQYNKAAFNPEAATLAKAEYQKLVNDGIGYVTANLGMTHKASAAVVLASQGGANGQA